MSFDMQFSDIELARQLIDPYIHKTPIMTCHSLNQRVGAKIFFKCENLQKVGAFKIRGATHAVLKQLVDAKKYGVATHSSGNHGAALALAGRQQNLPAYVVMPNNASLVKREAVMAYGGQVIECLPTQQDREKTLDEIVVNKKALAVPPYNHPLVIQGQGTVALELIEQAPELTTVMVPVGGGGLISGTSFVYKSKYPSVKVIGCEPKGADDAYQSFYAKRLITNITPNTIADGLRATLGDITFAMIQRYVDDILTVSDEDIIAAMQLLWTRLKLLVEPSSAVPMAALLKHRDAFQGQKVGIILTGGNVDLKNLPWMAP